MKTIEQSILESVTTGITIFTLFIGYRSYLSVYECAADVIDLRDRIDALEKCESEDLQRQKSV